MNEKNEIAEIVNTIAKLAGIDNNLVKARLRGVITELINELIRQGRRPKISKPD
jgi:uncharacterized protein YidB (DUF937 family)